MFFLLGNLRILFCFVFYVLFNLFLLFSNNKKKTKTKFFSAYNQWIIFVYPYLVMSHHHYLLFFGSQTSREKERERERERKNHGLYTCTVTVTPAPPMFVVCVCVCLVWFSIYISLFRPTRRQNSVRNHPVRSDYYLKLPLLPATAVTTVFCLV